MKNPFNTKTQLDHTQKSYTIIHTQKNTYQYKKMSYENVLREFFFIIMIIYFKVIGKEKIVKINHILKSITKCKINS